jgi:hypothetical protein
VVRKGIVLDVILKIVGALGGVIGTALGIYNYVHARRKETREETEKQTAKEQEQREWEYYTDFLKASREGYIAKPEDGSESHKVAERFVAKGMLVRLPGGRGYAIPGQQFLYGGESKKKDTT